MPDWSSLFLHLAGSGAMIHITAQMRVLLAIEAVDGRAAEWMPWNRNTEERTAEL